MTPKLAKVIHHELANVDYITIYNYIKQIACTVGGFSAAKRKIYPDVVVFGFDKKTSTILIDTYFQNREWLLQGNIVKMKEWEMHIRVVPLPTIAYQYDSVFKVISTYGLVENLGIVNVMHIECSDRSGCFVDTNKLPIGKREGLYRQYPEEVFPGTIRLADPYTD